MRARSLLCCLVCVAVAVSLWGCSVKNGDGPNGPSPPVLKTDIAAIASEACEGVGVVKETGEGVSGAPVVILEEDHSSRAGQIQHAITLVRLYNRHNLRHIALEGYLKERPPIETDWWQDASEGLEPSREVHVGVRLLREGEISAAEFMKLVYDDVNIIPVETISEYDKELSDDAATAPHLCLLKIAQESLGEEHVHDLMRFQEEIEGATGDGREQKTKEMFNYILSADPWAAETAKKLETMAAGQALSTGGHLDIARETQSRAEEKGVSLEPEEKQAMADYIAFFEARQKASTTMTRLTGETADQKNVTIIALNVGYAHTANICSRLRAVDRPFAVVRPLVLENGEHDGDLTWEMFDRKRQRVSVFSEGFTSVLMAAFPGPEQKKPEPVLSEAWCQAKSELYLFTERITQGILGPPSPPEGGPPYGFADDEFDGRWVRIDPNRITIVPDDEETGEGRAVLFPVTLNPEDPRRRTEVWVKAGKGATEASETEERDVEAMLFRALEDVQAEKAASAKAEDAAGRVQITLATTAACAKTQSAARAVRVTI